MVFTEPVDLVRPLDLQLPGIDIGMTLTVIYSCPGSELCKPETVLLLFMTSYDDIFGWEHMRSHNLVMLADAVRIDLGELEYEASHMIESMSIRIPLETFRLMTWAGRLIGKLGTTEFELTNREPFRALFEKMPVAK